MESGRMNGVFAEAETCVSYRHSLLSVWRTNACVTLAVC